MTDNKLIVAGFLFAAATVFGAAEALKSLDESRAEVRRDFVTAGLPGQLERIQRGEVTLECPNTPKGRDANLNPTTTTELETMYKLRCKPYTLKGHIDLHKR